MPHVAARLMAKRARSFLGVRVVALCGVLLALGACDMNVTDPGALKGSALDDPSILPGLLNGVRGSFTYAASGPVGGRGVFVAGALLSDELVYSGTDIDLARFSEGRAEDDWDAVTDLWAETSRARWTAERFVERLDELVAALPGTADSATVASRYNSLAEGLIWAGFTNRMLGENFCDAVIDEGPLEDRTAYFERAEGQFTRAIDMATAHELTELLPIAIGGRAQVRMLLGDWSGATADAALVPTEFEFKTTQHYPSDREVNGFRAISIASHPELTAWGTPFADWGKLKGSSSGDARIPLDRPKSDGEYVIGADGRRPFWQQLKYSVSAATISLVKGTEMRLIEGEAALVAGDWEGAVAKVQEVHDFRGLDEATAADEDEAWALLMRERGTELWLEGRRVGDLRRWAEVPGTVPFTVVREATGGDPEADERRNVLDVPGRLCIPVSRLERLTNPNL
jgi:hypothetical protein